MFELKFFFVSFSGKSWDNAASSKPNRHWQEMVEIYDGQHWPLLEYYLLVVGEVDYICCRENPSKEHLCRKYQKKDYMARIRLSKRARRCVFSLSFLSLLYSPDSWFQPKCVDEKHSSEFIERPWNWKRWFFETPRNWFAMVFLKC